ncbi:MAG: hypothetical protein ACRDO7_13875 [Nocardioidaceae bacterium]
MSNLAEAAEGASAVSPYVVGGVTLAIFVVLVLGVLSFGKGREHT